MSKRVVVTGMGAVTPIGNDLASYWSGLKEGKVGIGFVTSFDTTEFDIKFAAEVKDFDPNDYLDKKKSRRFDRFSQFAYAATRMAVDDSKLEIEDDNNVGIIIGSGMGGMPTIENEHRKLIEKGPKRVSPFFIQMAISNMAASNVAIELNLKGPWFSVVTACASATHSIGEAYKYIQDGTCDVVVAGGAESTITPLALAGFTSITALAKGDDPSIASRPFDKDRNGFVMGEGAGILIMEEYDRAIKRGAKIYAEVVGFGSTCDAFHMTAPDENGDGIKRAMELAIKSANIQKEDITYINAHGTSTPLNDLTETIAVKNLFKDHAYNLYMTSTKGHTGHLLGAAGGIEAIACCMSLYDSFIPGTMGHEEASEDMDLNYLPKKGIVKDYNYAMSNSLGFGGHNGSLIFKKYRG